ncbi:MAG: hypothetical protein IT539_08065 [Bradyrhizobiaceae bacterium]|nr:hypothetical protein [Bradyrhizobiaceae bacterium]
MQAEGNKAVRAALAAFAAFFLAAAQPAAGSVTNELVVADPRAGVALYGFDPVSYFLDGEPRGGSEQHELRFGGFFWRFASEANRAAFQERPDAYVPAFGGYDPIALTRGAPVPGHPAIFVVHEGHLFLFQRPEHRDAFVAAPIAMSEAARAAWPLVRRTLVH